MPWWGAKAFVYLGGRFRLVCSDLSQAGVDGEIYLL